MSTNSNWYEDDEGWHKNENSHQKGSADYFSRPIPPVRDAATGHPIGSDGKIDWGAVIQKINEDERNRGGG